MRRNNIFKILFFITVPIILLGATVIVIIISQGSSITNQGVVTDTGVLHINTDPTNIQYKLYVDDVLISSLNNQGTNISNGVHNIRIEATGMSTWQAKVTINSGVVNEVYAKLFPTNMALTQLTNTNIDKVFFSVNGDYAYYVVKDTTISQDQGIWKIQLSSNNIFFLNNSYTPVKVASLDKTNTTILSSGNYSLIPSPDNSKLLITNSVTKQALIIESQILNQQPQIVDLVSKLGYFPDYIHWFNNSNSLIIKDQHVLFEYNLSSSIFTLIKYSPDVDLIFDANGDQVVYFDPLSKSLELYKNQTSTPVALISVVLPQDTAAIYVPAKSDRFIMVQTSTNYELLDLEKNALKTLLTKDYTWMASSPDGLTYLFKSKTGTITTLSLTENIGLNILESKASVLDIPTLTSSDNLFFTPQSSFLLYFNSKDSKIYTFDKDGTNKLLLLDSKYIQDYFNFDNNANNLLVLLQDSSQNITPSPGKTATTQSHYDLYRLDLVKTAQ